jgi:hypothetical protein
MKAVAGILALALTVTGCARWKDMIAPAPAPPPARSASLPPPLPSAPPPVPSLSSPVPASPPPTSIPPSSPPAALPPTPSPVPPAPPPPRVLSPQLEDEDRVQREAQSRIDGTERLVRQIDQKKLVGDQQQNFLSIQSFLAKAREAISARDVERAFSLADKAYVLAKDLSRAVR